MIMIMITITTMIMITIAIGTPSFIDTSFPEPGAVFQTGGLRVTVLEMDGRRVEKVLVERIDPETDESPKPEE